MKIKVIFYKSKWWDGHCLDNAISIWTWLISSKNRKVGPYSHVEIWTPDEDGHFKLPRCYLAEQRFLGTCWTSTMRGKDNGTVKRHANTVIKNVKRWDECEVEVDDIKQIIGLAYMEEEVENNKGYSKKDLGKFFGLVWLADKLRNICSEFCNNYLTIVNVLTGWGVVSPRRLAWKLVQAGYEIKPMSSCSE